MRKIILNSLIVSLTFGGAVMAFAETNTSSKSLGQEVKTQIRKKENASSTLEKNIKREDEIKKRAEHRFSKMVARFDATIQREEAIMVKINSRIEKIKTVGGKTTDAEGLVVVAKTHLDKAKTALVSLKASADSAITQDISATSTGITKNTLTAMKKAGADIEKELRETHKAMQKTIGVLRGLSQLNNATTTGRQDN